MTTEERLEKLERELTLAKRHNRWLLTAAGLIVLTLVLARMFTGGLNTAQAQGAGSEGKVIRANLFILEDERGRIRAGLTMFKDGPGLVLYDEKGMTRAVLAADNDGPKLTLADEKGNTRAALGAHEAAPTALVLFDDKSTSRAFLVVAKDGPVLGLMDEKGKPLWSAP